MKKFVFCASFSFLLLNHSNVYAVQPFIKENFCKEEGFTEVFPLFSRHDFSVDNHGIIENLENKNVVNQPKKIIGEELKEAEEEDYLAYDANYSVTGKKKEKRSRFSDVMEKNYKFGKKSLKYDGLLPNNEEDADFGKTEETVEEPKKEARKRSETIIGETMDDYMKNLAASDYNANYNAKKILERKKIKEEITNSLNPTEKALYEVIKNTPENHTTSFSLEGTNSTPEELRELTMSIASKERKSISTSFDKETNEFFISNISPAYSKLNFNKELAKTGRTTDPYKEKNTNTNKKK